MTDNSPWPDQQPGDGNAMQGTPAEASGAGGGRMDFFIREWRRAREARRDWLIETDDMFGLRDGHHWSAEDVEILTEQKRPTVTFNRCGAYVDSIGGMEVNNRQEAQSIPRIAGGAPDAQAAGGKADLMSSAMKYVRDECDAEDEESEAFMDALTCGEGWTQTTMNYDDNPDGDIIVELRDPRCIYPFSGSGKANYADMRGVFYPRKMPLSEARTIAPDVDDQDIDASWVSDDGPQGDPINRRLSSFYRDPMDGKGDDGGEDRNVTVVEVEWWTFEVKHRVARAGGGFEHLTPDDFANLTRNMKAAGMGEPESVRDRQKVYRRAILGSKVLFEGAGPEQGGFTLKAITGKRDRKKNCWYGIVRAMKDPQMWSNKFLSQTMHIMNTGAKGGAFAEADAFANWNEAQDQWAQADALIKVNPSALSSGKIQQREPPAMPPALQFLLQFAVSSVSDCVGANPEMMGQADRAQAGVVEQQRKDSAMVIFARLFSNLRRYRKEQGRLLIWLIQKFISDGRLIRIGGADQAKFIPLMRDNLMERYDLVVDESPTSPNMKERTWGAIMALFPVLQRMNVPPTVMLAMLEYSPLPSTLVAKLGGMLPPPQQGPTPIMQAEIADKQAGAALKQAQAQHTQAQAQKVAGLAPLEAQEKQANIELARAQAINQIQNAMMSGDDTRFQQMHTAIDSLLEVAKAHTDAGAQVHQQAMSVQQAQQAAQQQQFEQSQPQPTPGDPASDR